jgi:hypothetical protein
MTAIVVNDSDAAVSNFIRSASGQHVSPVGKTTRFWVLEGQSYYNNWRSYFEHGTYVQTYGIDRYWSMIGTRDTSGFGT